MALKWQHAKRALELVVAIVVVVAAVAVVITANVYILDTQASSEFYKLLFCIFAFVVVLLFLYALCFLSLTSKRWHFTNKQFLSNTSFSNCFTHTII